jgi:hypothetical protein
VTLRLQPTRVAAVDAEGLLVFSDAGLIAVLVCLSELHKDAAGHWFLEAAFGELDGSEHPIFPDIDTAQTWIDERLRKAEALNRAKSILAASASQRTPFSSDG